MQNISGITVVTPSGQTVTLVVDTEDGSCPCQTLGKSDGVCLRKDPIPLP